MQQCCSWTHTNTHTFMVHSSKVNLKRQKNGKTRIEFGVIGNIINQSWISQSKVTSLRWMETVEPFMRVWTFTSHRLSAITIRNNFLLTRKKVFEMRYTLIKFHSILLAIHWKQVFLHGNWANWKPICSRAYENRADAIQNDDIIIIKRTSIYD